MNLHKKTKKIYSQWINNRALKEFYMNQSTRPRGARFIQYLLGFCFLCVFAFWRASSYRAVMINTLLVLILMATFVFISNRWELARARKEYRSKLAHMEYSARLEQSSQHDVLVMLQQKIAESYPVSNLTINGNNVLEGRYNGQKTAIYYLYPDENGIVETKDIINILRECRQNSINTVRIFTDGLFSNKSFTLAERYGIDLKLNDGDRLRSFLKNSSLAPTEEEMDTIIKLTIQKRKRRMQVISKQMLHRKKTGHYLLYSGILFVTAWLKIGVVGWNIVFAFLLLALAIFSFALKKSGTEEEEGLF